MKLEERLLGLFRNVCYHIRYKSHACNHCGFLLVCGLDDIFHGDDNDV